MKFELLVATNNEHKLNEIRQILSPYNVIVYAMKDLNLVPVEVEENGKTYFDNALIKAQALQKLTKMPIIADDSGLEIKSMGNQPGIYSARYAKSFGGHHNAIKNILKEILGKDRSAQFVCDIALLNVEDKPVRFEGIAKGHIAFKEEGKGGFGYDPIFISEETNKSFAIMCQEEKNKVSHRGKALQQLLNYLKDKNLIY